MIGVAAFVVWAVASSGSGTDSQPKVELEGGVPPADQASPLAVRLANAIGRASLGGSHRRLDMRRIAPLAWERMFVFANASGEQIDRALGFRWVAAPATVPRRGEHESLLAFVRGPRVVASAFFPDAIAGLDCLAAPGGYPRATDYLVRFRRRRPPRAYLAPLRPAAGEAACLRAVGAR